MLAAVVCTAHSGPRLEADAAAHRADVGGFGFVSVLAEGGRASAFVDVRSFERTHCVLRGG